MCLAKIFSQSVPFLLILLTVPLAVQQSLILMKSKVSNISSMDIVLLVYLENHQTQSPLDFHLSYLVGGFIVLHFTFKLIICFELLFVEDVRPMSRLGRGGM